MNDQTIRYLRGVNDLLSDAVEAGTKAIEEVHQGIACVPYDILAQIEPITAPAQLVERLHQTITQGVYRTIRTVSALTNSAAHAALDHLEGWVGDRETQTPEG